MKEITKHPLYSTADVIKRAFLINGFDLYDDNQTREIISIDKSAKAFCQSEEFALKPILLQDGDYCLRTELTISELTKFNKSLPIKNIICGKVYDASDSKYPAHLRIEGVMASSGVVLKDIITLFTNIASEVYGVNTTVKLNAYKKDCYNIICTKPDQNEITFGIIGKANWITKALLSTEENCVDTFVFTIDVDTLALDRFNLADRAALYDNRVSYLSQNKDTTPYVGDNIINKTANLLRNMGFTQYFGMKLYPDGIYKKMNMIQESWDSNNVGVALVEPLGEYAALPTVLTPAVEQALADNFKSGETNVKIFEISHIFLPDKTGNDPKEKIAVSIGAYGEDVDSTSFKKTVDEFLTKLGIDNHFFFPTNMAIAYDTSDTWLILDEKMKYLEGNFGGISPIAENNFGIGTHAFMANIEIEALDAKVKEEYYFVPSELM